MKKNKNNENNKIEAAVRLESRPVARRALLGWLGAGALSLHAPAVLARTEPRTLAFYHTHTGEELSLAYWNDTGYDSDALGAINHILRDHRTGDVESIDRGLLDLLSALRGAMESTAPFEVISGYRSPKTNGMLREKSGGVAKKSLHMKGQAIDIRLRGHDLRDLRAAALALRGGGVGFYAKSDFIHVDTGRVRQW